MNRIKLLPDKTVRRIKAGEVIDRPASAFKELIENAIDAGAKRINAAFTGAGKHSLSVADDGTGMGFDDAVLACERHSTSKITAAADIDDLRSYGFRGEALFSIAQCSQLELKTRSSEEDLGTVVRYDFGALKGIDKQPLAAGTTVTVSHIFREIPARRRFMRTNHTERMHLIDRFQALCLANPGIAFSLHDGGKELVFCPQTTGISRRLQDLAAMPSDQLLSRDITNGDVSMQLLAPQPDKRITRHLFSRIWINRRPVRVPLLARQLNDWMKRRYVSGERPFYLLFITAPPATVDVNTHPQKLEVRFRAPGDVIRLLARMLEQLSHAAPRLHVAPSPVSALQEQQPMYQPPRPAPQAIPSATAHQGGLLPAGMHVVGQVLDTYIVAERSGEMLLIDQHALFERFRYDQLLAAYQTRQPVRQGLLIPVTVPRNPAHPIPGWLDSLNRLGFDIDTLEDVLVIRKVPKLLERGDIKQMLFDLFQLLSGERSEPSAQWLERIIATMACHSSLRGNYPLTREHQQHVISLLDRISQPTCPHGRPVMVSLERKDLERLFKRSL